MINSNTKITSGRSWPALFKVSILIYQYIHVEMKPIKTGTYIVLILIGACNRHLFFFRSLVSVVIRKIHFNQLISILLGTNVTKSLFTVITKENK